MLLLRLAALVAPRRVVAVAPPQVLLTLRVALRPAAHLPVAPLAVLVARRLVAPLAVLVARRLVVLPAVLVAQQRVVLPAVLVARLVSK
jgi:hypothetical protein